MLYIWPRDQTTAEAGALHVVALTNERIIDVRGESYDALAARLSFDRLLLKGSGFTHDYTLWRKSDPQNSTPKPLREAMVRVENATDIEITHCGLIDAGQSGVWIEGFSQNVTVASNWIERPGFCGVFLNGPVPGETASGVFKTAADAYVNKFHNIHNNVIFDYGQRVGHGSGVWFYQSGDTKVTNNVIREGP